MIYLAILNITSWVGQCADAEHLYAHLILSENPNVNVENIEEWSVNYLGKSIEIRQQLTLEIATRLDEKEGGNLYRRGYSMLFDSDREEIMEKYPELVTTNRFDTFDQAVNAGVAKWKELNIDCPFISLYEGEKYYKNDYNKSETVYLQYGE